MAIRNNFIQNAPSVLEIDGALEAKHVSIASEITWN